MGTLGCIHDMMRRDKENRELRQRNRGAYEGNAPANDRMPAHGASSYSFRGKTGGDKETDTRKRTNRPKPCLQNQTDCRVSHACSSSIMRILALNLYTLFISVRLSGAV